MFLKRIEVFGFKSFMNKVEVDFGSGMTCVIGPNGCGKSNISDAIRWVLGEQNPRLLRGESMDDVIFNGTRVRKPLGMAEVSLILSNEARTFPIDFPEIRVTRRVYRSGVSEYLINKNNCRLKDIRDLLMDTGLGSSTYTVMERQQTDNLLGNTSVNLRIMVEEAAGIMKYKTQEKAAMRKLDATQVDLLRIRDIVAEVEKRVRSLNRQIGKANRHQELSAKVREFALYAGRLELERLQAEEAEKSGAYQEISLRQEEVSGRLATIEADVEEKTLALREKEEKLRGAQDNLNETMIELERTHKESLVLEEREKGIRHRQTVLENEITEANERIKDTVKLRWEKIEARDESAKAIRALEDDLEERRAKNNIVQGQVERAKDILLEKKQITLDLFKGESEKRNELGNLETSRTSLSKRRESLHRQVASLDEENTALAQQATHKTEEHEQKAQEALALREKRDKTERAIEKLATERAENAEQVVLLQGKTESLASTLKLLNKLREDYEGYKRGVRSLLATDDKPASLIGVVGELLDVDAKEYLPAFENAMGDALQCVVVDSESDALDLVHFLRENEQGWATFLPRDRFKAAQINVDPALASRDDVIGSASDFIRGDDATGHVLRVLLGRTILVRSLDAARALSHEEKYSDYRFVTADGEGARFPGIVFGGGSEREEVGIFERRSRIADLESEKNDLTKQLEKGRAQKEKLDGEFEKTRFERERIVAELDALRAEVEKLSRERERLQTGLEKSRESVEHFRNELAELDTEENNVLGLIQAVAQEFESIGAHGSEADRGLKEIETEMVQLETEREESRKGLTAAQVALAEAEGNRRTLEGEALSLERREQELADEVTRKREELRTSADTLTQIEERIAELREQEAGLAETKEMKTAARDEILAEVNRISDGIRAQEDSARGDRKARETVATEVHQLEMRLQEIKLGRTNLLERMDEEFEVGREEILEAEPVEEMTEQEIKHEVHQMKEAIRRLGPVNLVALDEYDEEAERFEFLKEQEGDLIEARDSLQETIKTVDRKARTLFVDTFELVRENFRNIFTTLFQGGEADLVMEVPDDPLNSPLEIVARPGNKRPQRIALLSGGERALTATSVLFALYQVKPSPFCILDELDAPLDDANVGRFLRMVEKFGDKTQFVVITHNRQTMSGADYLYGVTMQESGVSRVVSVRLGKDSQVGDEEEAIRQIESGAVS